MRETWPSTRLSLSHGENCLQQLTNNLYGSNIKDIALFMWLRKKKTDLEDNKNTNRNMNDSNNDNNNQTSRGKYEHTSRRGGQGGRKMWWLT